MRRTQPSLFAAVLLACLCAILSRGARADQSDTLHWSFRPIDRPRVPPIRGTSWVRNAIDRFVLRRLEDNNIMPSSGADRTTLMRRVTLDLIGLPPTPTEVESFLQDDRAGAYARLIDRLLASPHYGEKWARTWMDLCHYADTDGYLTDQLRPYAWRYRDWLITALNFDLPFDQFTVEQLAGDLLPEATIEQHVATGFLRQTLSNREGGADLEEFRVLQVVDRTSMVGTIWLGLTVGCARCHDHLFDPISQHEFYELYAQFNNVDEVNIDAPLPTEVAPYRDAFRDYMRQRRQPIAPVEVELNKLQRRWELQLLYAYQNPGEDAHWDRQWELLGLVWGGGFGEGQLEGVEITKLDPSRRTPQQSRDLQEYFLKTSGDIDPTEQRRLKLDELSSQLSELKSNLPPASRAPVVMAALNPRPNYVQHRGDFRDRGERVRPDVPQCLPPLRCGQSNSTKAGTEAYRLAFARWLVAHENPLTARVTVNRMWQEFFGRGIVATSEDFGARGEPASHPQLLDWLAAEFIESGWSVKTMHRLIVTSSTYRQASVPRPKLAVCDQNNRLLSRQNSLRVTAEAIRDQTLAVSGLLSRKIGGPSVKPPQPLRVIMEAFDNKQWQASSGSDRYRRSVYTFAIRTAPFAQSAIFDAPNPNETCTRRERSNTPLQALTLLNDEVFFEAAQALAARIMRVENTAPDFDSRIQAVFRLCLLRNPTVEEKQRLIDFFHVYRDVLRNDPQSTKAMLTSDLLSGFDAVEAAAWTGVSSVLLNVHEFITRN